MRTPKQALKKKTVKTARKSGGRRIVSSGRAVDLLVATIKGAFVLKGEGTRREWTVASPHFLGSETNHLVRDPRDRKTLLLAARTGHLGPTVFRSDDAGRSWQEAKQPPAFPRAAEGTSGPVVQRTFFLAPGHESQPGVWWAGTVPHALFRSEDGGATWALVDEFSRYVARLKEQKPANIGETPGGPITHSIIVDPRDANHVYVSLSTGGFFETSDGARSWRPMNEGSSADFLPDKFPEYGQDPHSVVMSPANPDRLYQQNHCGVYRLDRPGVRWDRIGRTLPAAVGDIGFPVVAHPRNQDVVWVFPMDGTEVWPRTSPGGKPAAFCSRNAGASWVRQAKGFPEANGWFTVFRQAMKSDTRDPVGLYLGTTAGEIWASRDEGESWKQIAEHLPRILSLEVAER
jgi:photosystem II stability/assembly factor-like uncharacterized protein